MATYYGQVKGQGETIATRTGSKSSGISVSAQSWTGSVIVDMFAGKVRVGIGEGSTFWGYNYFDGTLDELKEVLTLGKKALAER